MIKRIYSFAMKIIPTYLTFCWYDSPNMKIAKRYFHIFQSIKQISKEYPLYKILRAIVKKFMLNELEIIFFLHIVQEQNWNFNNEVISNLAKEMNGEFLNIIHEVQKQDEYKRLVLHLISCAFAVKGYLNDQNEVSLITAHINTCFSQDFAKHMENWRSKFMNGGVKIQPRIINKFFVSLTKSHRENQNQIQDYNALVDQIIQISPPYNQDKNNNDQLQNFKQEAVLQPQFLNTITQHEQCSNTLLQPQSILNFRAKPNFSEEEQFSLSIQRQRSIQQISNSKIECKEDEEDYHRANQLIKINSTFSDFQR